MYIDSVDLSYIPVSGDANIVINCFMENREQQILSEIKVMMASVRSQLERLDAKMAELQQIVDPEEFDAESIDIDIVDEVVEQEKKEEVQEISLEMEEPEPESDDLPVVDDLPVAEETPAVEDVPETEDTLLVEEVPVAEAPAVEEAPAAVDETLLMEVSAEPAPILNEVLAPDCAWRKDMPGTPVRDIRSAIGLNDRVIFINQLFKEDAQGFVNTLSRINAMESLEEAVGYICTEYPGWDMNSELVYRFMMAVRRKVR